MRIIIADGYKKSLWGDEVRYHPKTHLLIFDEL